MDTNTQHAREIEIKLDLGTFASYLKLVGFLGQIDREELHHNTFFDSRSRILYKHGWALRLRMRTADAVLTAKGISSVQGGASVRTEVEEVIPRIIGSQILERSIDLASLTYSPIVPLREFMREETVEAIIWFENLRRIRSCRLGDRTYELELDQTEFADGTVHYELEVELESTAHIATAENDLRRLFDQLDIPYSVQAMSKFERALALAPRN